VNRILPGPATSEGDGDGVAVVATGVLVMDGDGDGEADAIGEAFGVVQPARTPATSRVVARPYPRPARRRTAARRGIVIAWEGYRAGSRFGTEARDAASGPATTTSPGVIVQLKDGSFVAFDAICTHAGCTVEWDAADAILLCPCHSAAFDPAHDGAVIEGPTQIPLSRLPIRVDTASGSIFLAG